MQKSAMIEKHKITWDNIEIPGLIETEELVLEKSLVDVPGFKVTRQIRSGITKIPVLNMKYRIDRDTATLKFWENFFENEVIHDGVLIRCDADGVVFDRKMLPQCECYKYSIAAYKADSPEPAVISVGVTMFDLPLNI